MIHTAAAQQKQRSSVTGSMIGGMRVLTPLLLVACWLASTESFTGLAPVRTVQRQASSRPYRTTTSSPPFDARYHGGTHQHQGRRARRGVVMAAKPPAAQQERVDPTVVEAALVEEDKNV